MPRGKPRPKAPDDPVAAVRKRIADAERANAARIRETVTLRAEDLEIVASLVELGLGTKADVMRQAVHLGLSEMHGKSRASTRTVWRDADAENTERARQPVSIERGMEINAYADILHTFKNPLREGLLPLLARGESGGGTGGVSLIDPPPNLDPIVYDEKIDDDDVRYQP